MRLVIKSQEIVGDCLHFACVILNVGFEFLIWRSMRDFLSIPAPLSDCTALQLSSHCGLLSSTDEDPDL